MRNKVLFSLVLLESVIITYLISTSKSESKPSRSLQEWRVKGKQFVFEENIVFYVDEKGESEANNRSVLLLHGFSIVNF